MAGLARNAFYYQQQRLQIADRHAGLKLKIFKIFHKHKGRYGLDDYIRYYNHDRLTLKLKGLSPVQYRTQPLTS